MARKARFVIPGQAMHVLVRGHNQQTIFAKELDYKHYLDWLRQAAKAFECAVHAFALMPNHAHILLTPQKEESLARAMQSLGRRYAQYFNQSHARSGTMWAGRFCSSLIDPCYVLRCQRYIELNPVRSGLESRPEDAKNTSYVTHIGGKGETWLIDHHSFWGLGNTPFERQLAWANFVQDGASHQEDQTITAHIFRSKPWVSPEFRAQNYKFGLDHELIKPRGRPKKI
jgi:putative transposase